MPPDTDFTDGFLPYSFNVAPRFLIFDRDRRYRVGVPVAVRSLGIAAIQTSFENPSPWQNGVGGHASTTFPASSIRGRELDRT